MISRTDIDCVLFDLGGVILKIDFNRCFSAWANFAGTDIAQIQNRFVFDEDYQKHERGEITAKEYFACLKQSLDINLSFEDFATGWNSIFTGEFERANEVLSEAKKHLPLYAFTNSNALHQTFWASEYSKVLSHFTQIFNSSEIGLRKPEAAAFQYISNSIDARLSRISFFDDLPENVEAARSLGIKAVLVKEFDDVERTLENILR